MNIHPVLLLVTILKGFKMYKQAFDELKTIGLSPKRKNGIGLVFAVSMDSSGRWFFCKKLGYHQESERKYLQLSQLPWLREVLLAFEAQDAKIRNAGGRVFISKNKIFRASAVSA